MKHITIKSLNTAQARTLSQVWLHRPFHSTKAETNSKLLLTSNMKTEKNNQETKGPGTFLMNFSTNSKDW